MEPYQTPDSRTTMWLSGPALLAYAVLGALGIFWITVLREPVDDTLLTCVPCDVPCWQGIVPGESTTDETRLLLEQSPYVRSVVHEGDTEWAGTPVHRFVWMGNGVRRDRLFRNSENRIWLHQNTVIRVHLYIDSKITIGEVVERYGPPEGILAEQEPRIPGSFVQLHYPSLGLSCISFTRDKRDQAAASLLSNMPITEVDYYAPTDMAMVLDEVFLLDPYFARHVLTQIRPWSGYGTVEYGTRYGQ